MTRCLLIRPRDPMMFRDGRPFEAGLGARTIRWPLPSTVAGFVRTRLWGSREFAGAEDHLRAVKHSGPFLATQNEKYQWDLCFPAPADTAVYGAKGAFEIIPLRPTPRERLGNATDCDLPGGLHPLSGARPEKASDAPTGFWTGAQTLRWLQKNDAQSWFQTAEALGHSDLPNQTRLHVEIGSQGRNAVDGMLFRTVSLEFDFDTEFRRKASREKRRPVRAMGIFSRIEAEDNEWSETDGAGPMGGEQRIAIWSGSDDLLPSPPELLGEAKRIRLLLVTPAVFRDGWKPGWLEEGEPPECPGLKLRLVSAAVARPVFASGFDMTKTGMQRLRASRALAPAGSVYFFEVEAGDPRQLWLKSISDKLQDRRDGFGLVLVGGWEWR